MSDLPTHKQTSSIDTPKACIQLLLDSADRSTTRADLDTPKQGAGHADVNIALCKYWGKRHPKLNLPHNSSLSISLPGLGTQTQVTWSPTESSTGLQQLTFNGETLSPDNATFQRTQQFLEWFPMAQTGRFEVTTHNSVPTAAGLASSASGYAALVLALDQAFGWALSRATLSILARLGSGSATRSMFSGFAIWDKGERPDGLDSYARPLAQRWDALRIGLVEVDTTQKPIGSTQGMQATTQTCALYPQWPQQAEADLKTLITAIEAHDFDTLGRTAEHNALSMHATMIATWPPIVYWQGQTLEAMQSVWALRAQGVAVYFTMDAGPNLKLLYLKKDQACIQETFENLIEIQPF